VTGAESLRITHARLLRFPFPDQQRAAGSAGDRPFEVAWRRPRRVRSVHRSPHGAGSWQSKGLPLRRSPMLINTHAPRQWMMAGPRCLEQQH